MKRGFLVNKNQPKTSKVDDGDGAGKNISIRTSARETTKAKTNVSPYNMQDAFTNPGVRVLDSPDCPPQAADEILCTVMPPDHPLIPGPHAVCLFTTPAHREAFLTTPGFPRPLTTPSPPLHRLNPTKNPHGRGLFLTSPITKNQLIISERPILVLPNELRAMELNFPPSFQASPQQKMRLQLQQWNLILETCVKRMDKRDQDAFWEFGTGRDEGFGPIMNRMQMNGLGIGVNAKNGELCRSVALFKNISRIGH
ncbi:hypothetical protein H0H93_015558, partial [Arthromyces matolae]